MAVISENKLKKIMLSVIEEQLSERGTNLSSLYHFTDIHGLAGIISTGAFNLSSKQEGIRDGKGYMSFTRHKSPLEGFAVPNRSSVRIEVIPEVINSIHDKSIDSFEYYSPNNAKKDKTCNPWSNMSSDNGDISAKAAYRVAKHNPTDWFQSEDAEYLNQAEEHLTSGKKFIDAEKAIKRVDIYAEFDKSFCKSYKEHIYRGFLTIFQMANSPLYDKIFIYNNMRDFSLQTDNCIPISEYSEEALRNDLGLNNDGGIADNNMLSKDIWGNYQNVSESRGRKIVISENRLRKIITSVIKEHLSERGTNLGSLYHFTNVKGLKGIIRSGHFMLSGQQKDTRGGKNYMSFTRHKTALEGYGAISAFIKCENPIRIEVSSDVLNSMHGTSIDSYEYYSPGNAKISGMNNPWHDVWLNNVSPDSREESAKAAYRKSIKAKREGHDDFSEYLNQAEESLTSNADSINAEKAIKRIDILVFAWRDGDLREEDAKYLPEIRNELYRKYLPIFQLANSPLYKKIFIYNDMQEFSLQTDKCIPISEFFEELRNYLEKDNGGGIQRTVAEGIIKTNRIKNK